MLCHDPVLFLKELQTDSGVRHEGLEEEYDTTNWLVHRGQACRRRGSRYTLGSSGRRSEGVEGCARMGRWRGCGAMLQVGRRKMRHKPWRRWSLCWQLYHLRLIQTARDASSTAVIWPHRRPRPSALLVVLRRATCKIPDVCTKNSPTYS